MRYVLTIDQHGLGFVVTVVVVMRGEATGHQFVQPVCDNDHVLWEVEVIEW